MKENNIESPNVSEERARMRILEIRDEVNAMGGNDYEFSALKKILEKLKTRQISGYEAVGQALEIRNRKEDYH